jgi:AcrR family transcriptional regulator
MPKVGLTREKVVEKAAAVADDAGLDHLTLTAVAQRRGVSLPGLYKHVPRKPALPVDLAETARLSEFFAGAEVHIMGRVHYQEMASYCASEPAPPGSPCRAASSAARRFGAGSSILASVFNRTVGPAAHRGTPSPTGPGENGASAAGGRRHPDARTR